MTLEDRNQEAPSEETEHWIWGPVQITNDQGFSKIIYADENGNVFDYKENTPQ